MRMKATLKLDIPSAELTTKPGTLARLFGAKPKPLGHERVVGSTLGIVEQIMAALHTLQIDNVISLRVDMSVLFEDQQGQPRDLPHLAEKLAEHTSQLSSEFQMIQLAMEHRAQSMHYVLDLTLRGEVPTGDEELLVGIAGRPEGLEPTTGMSAGEYRDSVAEYAAGGRPREDWQAFTAFVQEARRCLAAHLHASRHDVSHEEIGITVPSQRSLCASVSTPFDDHEITFRRRGYTPDCRHYYRDPYSHSHENPHTALLNLFLLANLRDGTAVGILPDTKIYNADGFDMGTIDKVDTMPLDEPLLRELRTAEMLVGLDSGQWPQGSLIRSIVTAQAREDSARIGRIAARGRRARAGSRASTGGTSCRVDSSDSPA